MSRGGDQTLLERARDGFESSLESTGDGTFERQERGAMDGGAFFAAAAYALALCHFRLGEYAPALSRVAEVSVSPACVPSAPPPPPPPQGARVCNAFHQIKCPAFNTTFSPNGMHRTPPWFALDCFQR